MIQRMTLPTSFLICKIISADFDGQPMMPARFRRQRNPPERPMPVLCHPRVGDRDFFHCCRQHGSDFHPCVRKFNPVRADFRLLPRYQGENDGFRRLQGDFVRNLNPVRRNQCAANRRQHARFRRIRARHVQRRAVRQSTEVPCGVLCPGALLESANQRHIVYMLRQFQSV